MIDMGEVQWGHLREEENGNDGGAYPFGKRRLAGGNTPGQEEQQSLWSREVVWFEDRYPDRALDVLWGSSAYMHVFSPTSPQDNVFSQP